MHLRLHPRMLRALRAQGLIPTFSSRAAVLLAQGPVAANRAWKWLRIATEGSELSRSALQQMVANFQSDPRYERDPSTGLGRTKVVPYDFEFASQTDPTTGVIPTMGAPAPAWCMDLQIRQGADGKAQLWAWTKLGRRIMDDVEAYEVGLAFLSNARDPETGTSIGHRIISIALLERKPITATSKHTGRVPYASEAGTMQGMQVINVTALDTGINNTERLLSHLRREKPGFANRSLADQVGYVRRLRQSSGVRIVYDGEDAKPVTAPSAMLSMRAQEPTRVIEITEDDEGPSHTARLMSALERTDPMFAKLSWHDKCTRVHQLKRDPSVRIVCTDLEGYKGAVGGGKGAATPQDEPEFSKRVLDVTEESEESDDGKRIFEVKPEDRGRNTGERMISALFRKHPHLTRTPRTEVAALVEELYRHPDVELAIDGR